MGGFLAMWSLPLGVAVAMYLRRKNHKGGLLTVILIVAVFFALLFSVKWAELS